MITRAGLFVVLLVLLSVWGFAAEVHFVEHHRIRVVNRYFGAVSVSLDKGESWKRIGRVLRPLAGKYKEIAPREFTASDWAPIGSVAATAVNAIHIKVDQMDPHAALFSILPLELGPHGNRLKSYFDQPSTLFISIDEYS